MLRVILIWFTIINTSTIALSDTMLVAYDEVVEVGDIEINESRRVQIPQVDSVRVVFRLGNDWIGTDILPLRDTIRIDDNTMTFEIEICEE